MAVLRPEFPEEQFTRLRNCWLRDERLSLKGKGLLGYLMSHAAGFRVSQALIVKQSRDARAAVVSGLEELEALGYLRRQPARSTGGRFAETDYELSDPFDASGQLRPQGSPQPGEPAEGAQGFGGFPDRSGFPAAEHPQRETLPLEDQREKRAPTEPALRLVEEEGPTIGQRANQLSREHYDAMGGMANVLAVAGIVRRALAATDSAGAPRWTDDAVRAALAALREAGRPITLQTLHTALQGGNVGARSYRQAGPYRDRRPEDYQDGF